MFNKNKAFKDTDRKVLYFTYIYQVKDMVRVEPTEPDDKPHWEEKLIKEVCLRKIVRTVEVVSIEEYVDDHYEVRQDRCYVYLRNLVNPVIAAHPLKELHDVLMSEKTNNHLGFSQQRYFSEYQNELVFQKTDNDPTG